MSKSHILNVANMSFYAIHENKVLAKISEFTVINIWTSNLSHIRKFNIQGSVHSVARGLKFGLS